MRGVLKKLLVVGVIFVAVPVFCQIEPEAPPPECPEGSEPVIDYLEDSDSCTYEPEEGWGWGWGWTRFWDLELISNGFGDTMEIFIWDSSSVDEDDDFYNANNVFTKFVKTTEKNTTWYG